MQKNAFTFQYGQIRNKIMNKKELITSTDLHSSMVRLEIAFILDINIK